jgi:hypothetical protein
MLTREQVVNIEKGITESFTDRLKFEFGLFLCHNCEYIEEGETINDAEFRPFKSIFNDFLKHFDIYNVLKKEYKEHKQNFQNFSITLGWTDYYYSIDDKDMIEHIERED